MTGSGYVTLQQFWPKVLLDATEDAHMYHQLFNSDWPGKYDH